MKKLISSAFAVAAALFMGTNANAQLADGSVAPDFTANDINGTSHHLYDYLNQGYTVVMDISAAWCGPCWAYHTSGALEELYINHGPLGMPGVSPNTTNDVMVFFIEGESTNTLAQIQGTSTGTAHSNYTQGNWTTGTPYPIIDNATIANNYEISYFPTVYKICPNRITTEVGQADAATLYSSVGSCPQATQTNNPSIIAYTGDRTSCTALNLKAQLQNMGTDNLTSATIKAYFNGAEIASYNWSGNIPTYNVEDIVLGTYTPTTDGNLSVKITSANSNVADDEVITALPSSYTGTQQVTVKITTDQFGSETTWKIKKANNQIVAQGGPYSDQASPGEYPQADTVVVLPATGCYTLQISDAYGDGMSSAAYGLGSVQLVDGNGVIVASEGKFTSSVNAKFHLDVLGVEENDIVSGIKVFPNPSAGNFSLNMNLAAKTNVGITVTNAMGQVVYTENKQSTAAGQHIYNMDLSAFADGIYLVTVNAADKRYTQLITIAK